MGRTENWQALFRKKGWLDGTRITAPKGYILCIGYNEEEVKVTGEGVDVGLGTATYLESDMVFITSLFVKPSPIYVAGSDRHELSFMWEDIRSAFISPGSPKR